MPLLKRSVEPRSLCRGALPEAISSELECVTNNSLSAIIRQLSSLSKHAEDIFGELFNEANSFYLRANSLQERIDRLAVKVTQLDSTVEEVSLQDINMKKAFKSSTIQDQQVVSKGSIPIPVVEMYSFSDKPPPLSILSPYRDDCRDSLKFYTDPSYFFDLWKEKMLQDTEDKRKEKRRQKEQRRGVDSTLPREVKKVRKARNRRQEWNMMAFDKELRPDSCHSRTVHQGAESEASLSPDSRSYASDHSDHSFLATPNHVGLSHMHPANHTPITEHDYHCTTVGQRGGTLGRPHQPPPPPPPAEAVDGTMPLPPDDYRMFSGQILNFYGAPLPRLPPAPLIPSAQTAFATPPGGLPLPPSISRPMVAAASYLAPPPAAVVPMAAPSPPGPPTPPPGPPLPSETQPMGDARSDLLAAIRMGIQLKKVQEEQEQQARRNPAGNDVATILSRRIAVEYSDSDDDSEPGDGADWSD
ncbi:wiskott-Aldrich syndrome protein family member 3b [Brienomyrus brachyistius]|uniref:wiskott-Aldrich syndrome protein family member 3b n=1 Tax=Brienomyrus brachyistius TaxID=42636 RepID=UPI0020B18FFB|nr:wiskott-Aldrich syndrome protein family member 3b [Brienomyrus brachyistius]